VIAVLRILFETASFRLRRLEMANMVAAGAIAVALRHPWPEVAWRLAFALGLNVLVYLDNDVADVQQDLISEDKDRAKTRFLSEHLGSARAGEVALLLGLTAVAATIDLSLFVPLLVGGGVCWAYSRWLKRRPFVDVAAMVIWGGTMPAVAFGFDTANGWALVGLLALISGAFESTQVLRDLDEDSREGVRTTAVVIGAANTRHLVRFFALAAGAYGGLVLHSVVGWIPALAVLLPRGDPSRDWNRLRAVCGVGFLAVLYFVWSTGELSGLLFTA
jgi:4-hydroxybenzoate polyprenyltransferase